MLIDHERAVAAVDMQALAVVRGIGTAGATNGDDMAARRCVRPGLAGAPALGCPAPQTPLRGPGLEATAMALAAAAGA